MSHELWSALDTYYADALHEEDPILETALAASQEAGLRNISVSESQGKMLMLFVMATGARRILEIGTLGGYSALWMARGLMMEGGPAEIITLEKDPQTASIAKRTIQEIQVEGLIDVRDGDANDTLRQMAESGTTPFDLIFMDADKASLPGYLAWALKLSHQGTMIIADNVVRHGQVLDPKSEDPDIRGIRQFIDLAGQDPSLECTVVQTVGEKGHDGFAMCVVK